MKQATSRTSYRIKRHARVRARVTGTPEKPRLAVFRSLRGMYAQLIDDTQSITLVGVHSKNDVDVKLDAGDRTGKVKIAFLLGKALAAKAQEKKISTVVFDRGGFAYHGRIAAVADGAREGGLQF